jgi:cytochrome c556
LFNGAGANNLPQAESWNKPERETSSMMRTILATAAVAIGATIVMAQGDPIATRKQTMKGVGDATKVGAAMAKGEAPFDAAKAREIFTTYDAAAKRMPTLFPENSKTGGETTAAPKIWEDMAGFRAGFAKFDKEANEALTATHDLDSFKAAFGTVTKNCGACHETYRIKKS